MDVVREGVPMIKRGGLRLLTSGEIRLATELYGKSIRYSHVWIHHDSYLPFGMQENNTAMTPNGEMWFETNVYRDDYSIGPVDYQHLYMHEMMHVWQYQHGMNIRMRGLVSWAVSYKYDLTRNSLSSYSMEQQASIVSDFWLLVNFGFANYKRIINYKNYDTALSVRELIDEYKKILKSFPQ